MFAGDRLPLDRPRGPEQNDADPRGQQLHRGCHLRRWYHVCPQRRRGELKIFHITGGNVQN